MNGGGVYSSKYGNYVCIVWNNGLIEAKSSGILYFFKLKYVPVIYVLKYFFNVCILNTNTWIAVIKFGGHHATQFDILTVMAAILDFITLIPP